MRSPEGRQIQIDVVGAYLEVGWFVESKYCLGQKVGLSEIKEFEERCWLAGKSLEVEEPVLWYFSLEGFTEEAETYIHKKDILGSNEEMLNCLLTRYGVRELPRMYEKSRASKII